VGTAMREEHLVIGSKRRHPAITVTGTTSDAVS
jgi:hypothetical protein